MCSYCAGDNNGDDNYDNDNDKKRETNANHDDEYMTMMNMTTTMMVTLMTRMIVRSVSGLCEDRSARICVCTPPVKSLCCLSVCRPLEHEAETVDRNSQHATHLD